MRPLELQVRNFRSYFGESPRFDFRGRSLVGVVGPIGSGKSSLLDAVAFALYGKTPAAGAGTKALIHQRTTDGAVRLRFEVDDDVWEVVRSLRQRGQSQHALYRYATDIADAEPVEKITLEADVNDRIVSLLGLDFDTFGRSILLAQGHFAEFLRARPAERDAVLKGVFGYDRIDVMREIARARAAMAAAELKTVLVRTEHLDRVAERLGELRLALGTADEAVERLRKVEPHITDLEGQIAAADAAGHDAEVRLTELSRHASRLPDLEATSRLLDEAADLSRRRAELAADLATAMQAVSTVEEKAAVLRTSGEPELLDTAGRLIAVSEQLARSVADAARRHEAVHSRLDEAVLRHASAIDLAGQHTVAVAAAERELRTAEEALGTAERTHHDAEHANMAAVLRRDLEAGAPCPVCAQEVAVVPPPNGVDVSLTAAELERVRGRRREAERRHTSAAAAASAAQQAVEAAQVAQGQLEAEAEQARLAHEEAETELAATRTRLAGLLGVGDPAQLLEVRRAAAGAVTDAVVDARRSAEQIRTRHDDAIGAELTAAKQLSTLRMDVVELHARLGRPPAAIPDTPAALGTAVAAIRATWAETVTELEATLAERRTAAAAARQQRQTTLDELGVTGEFVAALATEEARAAHLSADVASAETELAAGAELAALCDHHTAEKARYDRIAADLTDSRFVRFLLDGERARLADLGSEHFQRLSSGRYRFAEDGSFAIVDLTAADAVRKASSLSGGETFLASLALALSLAEMVTRTGGRLDAFFLDEGFGALDPEHLDLAMEGIEALVADDSSRLVVVVSHVPELRHRLEDLIQLDRDPITGDTRVVRS